MDVMEAARSLGTALAEHETHRAYREAEHRALESGDLDLIRDYQLKASIVKRLKQHPHSHEEEGGEEEGLLKDALHELYEAENLVLASAVAVDYMEKKQAFQQLMNDVNALIKACCADGCAPERCKACGRGCAK